MISHASKRVQHCNFHTLLDGCAGWIRRKQFGLLLCLTLLFASLTQSGCAGLTNSKGSASADPAPSIITQPASQTVTAGQTATFSVVVSGTAPLSYQWMKNQVNIAGATSASYTTPATTSADNGTSFRVIVTNAVSSVTSNAATLTVSTGPSITTQPANQTVNVGQTATFTVVATGAAPLSYQWQKNQVNIAGATSASYTTPATTSADNGTGFRVIVTNPVTSATSNSATLTVNTGPSITTQPANQTVNVGQTATFTVVATGAAPLSYQWKKNGTAISGATSSIFTTPAETTSDSGGQFNVVVSNSAGSATSSAAILTVKAAPPPPVAPLQIATTSIPNGQDNTPYQTTLLATGGIALYTWSASGALPSGVSMSETGVIAGIPKQPGQFQFTATVTDSSSPPQSASKPFTFQFATGATPSSMLAIGTSDLHTGLIQQPYLSVLTATGGTGSYDWSLASGSLPVGLQLSPSSGEIAGTPTQGGAFSFTITAADSSGATSSKNFSLQIFEQPLDEYGGFLNKTSSTGGNGYFRLEKTASNRWLFVDPLGNYFFPLFVEDMGLFDGSSTYQNALAAKYTGGTWSSNTWTLFTQQMVRRARSWGFNAIGVGAANYTLPIVSYGGADGPNSEKMPFVDMIKPALYGVLDGGVQDLIFGSDPTIYNGWRGASFPDVYSPLFTQAIQTQITAKENIYGTALDKTPWLIGEGMDDLDNLFGWRNSTNSPHTGWLTAVTSPVETLTIWPQYNSYKTLHTDTKVYTKAQWANFLQVKYGSVSALNTTWGSNYTTLGTTGEQVIGEILGTGDGSTRSFSKILADTVVDPHGLAVYVAGVIGLGDDGSGNLYDNAQVSNESPLGSINYSNGSLAVTFSTAPTAGAAITVNYVYGGWPKRLTGGTGLLDEDGSSPWIGKDFLALSDTNPTVKADMDAFLQQQLDTYFSQMSSAIHTWLPHHLIFGPVGLTALARPLVFQEASKYIDFVDVAADDANVQPAGGLAQAFLNVYSYFQKPIEAGTTITSQSDSPWAKFPRSFDDYPTQTARGQAYATELGTVVNLKGPDGVYFVVDFDIFAWTDKQAESGNFGLVSNLDNAYDGVEDQTSVGYDSWGFKTGGEAGNYGDFISPVSQANFNALRAILQQ